MKQFNIQHTDKSLEQSIQQKIDHLNKPKGSLGRLEELAMQICLIQQTLSPSLNHPCHLLLGGDHGIEKEGVSATPREVTWQQMVNFTRGGGGVNMFCRQHGFDLSIVDVGVDHDLTSVPGIINRKIAFGTRNFLHGPAMTAAEMEQCLAGGASVVRQCFEEGSNVLSFGEMGIGNTSPSSIWMSYFTGIPLAECVGAGSGLDSAGIRHKYEVLSQAMANYGGDGSPRDIIRWFGGFEMVMAVGAMLQAAELHMVILVDGFIMTNCMLAASKLYPEVLDYAVFGHCGDESGHRKVLDALGAKPILSLGLRLGEGTGAICAYPVLDSAVRMINQMDTFSGADITKYF